MQNLRSVWHTRLYVCAIALIILFPIFSPTIYVDAQPQYVTGFTASNSRGQYGSGHGSVGLPGARRGASSITDASGQLWLYGGQGFPASGGQGILNDLWKYNITTNQWTFVNGSTGINSVGVYPAHGQAGLPGARHQHAQWVAADGNMYIFGGNGYTTGPAGVLSDFWKYEQDTQRWIYLNGSTTLYAAGSYNGIGNEGYPGARQAMGYCADITGTKLYIFGGTGFTNVVGSSSPLYSLSDLWQYDVATSKWTLIAGGPQLNQVGVYTGGSVRPGGRKDGFPLWADNQQRLWLFGGYGYNTTTEGPLADLWMFNLVSHTWTFMGGSTQLFADPVYQGLGEYGEPGCRSAPNYWSDYQHNLWLFGGGHVDRLGATIRRSDFWVYDILVHKWSWVGGPQATGTSNLPAGTPPQLGARTLAATWLDKTGKVWVFGGLGPTSTYADLWTFTSTDSSTVVAFQNSSFTDTSIYLSWTSLLTYSYILQVSSTNSTWNTTYYGGAFTYNVTNLAPATIYYFRVCATNAGVCVTAYSDIITLSTSARVVSIAGSYSLQGVADGIGTEAQFTSPHALVVDSQRNFVLLDKLASTTTVRKITPLGRTNTVTTLSGQMHGMTKSATGYYVADNLNSVIAEYTENFDNPSTLIDGAASNDGTPGQTLNPSSLWYDATTTTLYFTQSNANGVLRTHQTGTSTTNTITGDFGINQLTVDSTNKVYGGSIGGAINKFDGTSISRFAGSATSGYADGALNVARFTAPSGVAVDKKGNLFVADRGVSMIRRTTSNGVVMPFAGVRNSGAAFLPGVGPRATFFGSREITQDPEWPGVMYVLDNGGLRMIYSIPPPESLSLTLVPGDSNVTATWSPPSKFPIAGVTSYKLIIYDSNHNVVESASVPVDTNTYSFTGLVTNEQYVVQILAANEYGNGPAHNESFSTAGDCDGTCNGHGSCNGGSVCVCTGNYTGTLCNQCKPQYNGYPSCHDCASGFYGPNCVACSAATNCSGHGTCSSADGSCVCSGNFTSGDCSVCRTDHFGTNCDKYCRASETCGETGNTCNNTLGTCVCQSQYNGTNCERCADGRYGFPTCTACSAATTCNNGGVCNTTNGACACNRGFTGANCQQCDTNYYGWPNCKYCLANDNCGGYGTCNTTTGNCMCNQGYIYNSVANDCQSCPPGSVGQNAGSCHSCPAGTSQKNQTTCEPCASGSVAPVNGSTTCTPCLAGFYSHNTTSCVRCEAGTVSAGNTGSCSQCPAGTYANTTTSTCVSCAQGTVSTTPGSTQCTKCSDGYYPHNTSSCAICPSGSVSTSGSANCATCPAGQYAHNATTCMACTSGTVASTPGATQCSPCAEGTHATNTTTCEQCDSGSVAGLGSTTCTQCAAGTHKHNATTCVACESGKTSAAGSASCTPCAAGTHAGSNSTACVVCEAGTTSQEGSANCTQCGAGQYAVNSTSCAPCAAGTHPTSNSTTCVACEPGSISQAGSASCTQCVAGEYAANSTACVVCENGQISAPGSTECNNCGAGFYSVNSTCHPCPVGTTAVPGSSHCSACPSGHIAINSTTCVACDAGTYAYNSTQCSPCEAGSVAGVASSSCHKCAPGEQKVDAATCAPCDAGTYEVNATCVPCDAGSVSEANSTVCTACTPGQYAYNVSTCLTCNAGSYAPNTTVCLPCDSNSVANEGSTSCTLCDIGHFPNTTTQTCVHCDAGYYYNGVRCMQCGYGSVAQPASTECTACVAGEYAINASTCVPCAPGSVSQAQSTQCIVCEAGSHSFAGTNCIACDAGTIAATDGLTECTACPAGSYAINSTACETCPVGSVANIGSTSCAVCNPGTYVYNTTTCVGCAPGFIAPQQGSLSCTPCDAGTFARNSTHCGNCPAVHVSKPGSTRCTQCGIGFYVFNASTCAASCGDGVCDASGEETCLSCPTDCPAPCGICGDGHCEASAGETCRNCIQDCKVCEIPKCPTAGGLECSGPTNGRCREGICTCNAGFTGPACDQKNIPVTVVVNTTTPTVVVTPPSSASSTTSANPGQAAISFSVNVKQLNEVNVGGAIAGDSYDLTNKTFLFEENFTPYSTVWRYNTFLENGAEVIVSLIFFNETTVIDFAGQVQTLAANELKMTVEVRTWPFISLRNSLDIILEAVVVSEQQGQESIGCQTQQATTDASGVLRWFKISVDDLSFYGQFLPLALVDDTPRALGIAYKESGSNGLVTVHSPVFFDNLVVDPNFSVLFGKNGGGDSTNGDPCALTGGDERANDGFFTTTNIIAIACAVGGAAIIGVAGALWFTNRKRKRRGSISIKNGKARATSSAGLNKT